MEGFGRYSVLNQAHARAKAEKTAKAVAQESKEAAREVTDRHLERRDRDPPVRKVERAEARPPAVDMSDPRPSRPMVADAWSMRLPNGPAPGESDRGYIVRRGVLEQGVRERRQAAVSEAEMIAKAEGADANPRRRNKLIQEILNQRTASAEGRQAQTAKDKDAGKGVGADDD